MTASNRTQVAPGKQSKEAHNNGSVLQFSVNRLASTVRNQRQFTRSDPLKLNGCSPVPDECFSIDGGFRFSWPFGPGRGCADAAGMNRPGFRASKTVLGVWLERGRRSQQLTKRCGRSRLVGNMHRSLQTVLRGPKPA